MRAWRQMIRVLRFHGFIQRERQTVKCCQKYDYAYLILFFSRTVSRSDPVGLPDAVTVGYIKASLTNQQGSNDVHRGIRHAEDWQVMSESLSQMSKFSADYLLILRVCSNVKKKEINRVHVRTNKQHNSTAQH